MSQEKQVSCEQRLPSPEKPSPASVPTSVVPRSTPGKQPSSDDCRFDPNKVERSWIIAQLNAYGAPLQKLKTLDATCGKVTEDAKSHHVTDAEIGRQQTRYGMKWRREYMIKRIKKANVLYINSTVLKLAKTVVVAGVDPDDPNGSPIAGVRNGGVENDSQLLLDQSILDYKHAAESRTQTTEEDAKKTMMRQKELRAEKRQRLDLQKEAYAKRKRTKLTDKDKRQRERRAADVQNLKAQTMPANAAAANVAIQRRQCGQFGLFLAIYASKNNLPPPQPETALPVKTQAEVLELDPTLLQDTSVMIQSSTPSESGNAADMASDTVKSVTEGPPNDTDLTSEHHEA